MIMEVEIRGDLSGYSNSTSIYEGGRLKNRQALDRGRGVLSYFKAGDHLAGRGTKPEQNGEFVWGGWQELS